MLKRSIVFPGGGMPLADIVDLAVRAEQRGFATVYSVEAWRSGLVPLAAIAARTERIGLGTYVLNAYIRSPLLAGMSAIDLDEHSGGRVLVTVGSGNRHINTAWHGVHVERPLEKMSEYVQILRKVVRTKLGQRATFAGEIHHMDWVASVEPVRASIPVYLAAMYPRMQRVAGAVADGIALAALCSPSYIRDVVGPRVRAGAEEAGRDPGTVRVLAAALTSVDEDRERARRAVRDTICRLFEPPAHPYYEFVMQEQGHGAMASAIARCMAEGRAADAVEAIPDGFIDGASVAGTSAECRERIAAFDGVVDELILSNTFGVDTTLGHDSPNLRRSYEELLTLGPGPRN